MPVFFTIDAPKDAKDATESKDAKEPIEETANDTPTESEETTNDTPYMTKKALDLTLDHKLVHVSQVLEGSHTIIDDFGPPQTFNKERAYFIGYAHGKAESAIITKSSVQFKYYNFLEFMDPSDFKMVLDIQHKDHMIIKSPRFAKHMKHLKQTGDIPKYVKQASSEMKHAYLQGLYDSKNELPSKPSITTITSTIAINRVKSTDKVLRCMINKRYLYNIQALYASVGMTVFADIPNKQLVIHNNNYIGKSVVDYLFPPPSETPVDIMSVCTTKKSVQCFGIDVGENHGYVVGPGLLTRADSSPCLRKGTRILTDGGIKPIDELEGRFFRVRNIKGQWSTARCWKAATDVPLCKITMGNNKVYYATADHKWPVLTTETPPLIPTLAPIPEGPEVGTVNQVNHVGDIQLDDVNAAMATLDVAALLGEQKQPAVAPAAPPPPPPPRPTRPGEKLVKPISTSKLGSGMTIPFFKNSVLTDATFGKGGITDGFCMGVLYGSSTLFIKDISPDSVDQPVFQYVWAWPIDTVQMGFGQILTNWIHRIDPTQPVEYAEKQGHVIYLSNSAILHEYITAFGATNPSEVKDSTYGLPQSVWTGSEDFRKGFIDGLMSTKGAIVKNPTGTTIGAISSKSVVLINDLFDLFGFYGIHSIVQPASEQTPALLRFDISFFGIIFNVSNTATRASVESLARPPSHRVGELTVAKVELTNLTEDVWNISVYDQDSLYALSHCMTCA
jgi:hypothetical protein